MRELSSFDHISLAAELSEHIGRHFQKISPVRGGYKLRFRGLTALFIMPDKIYPTLYSVTARAPDNLSLKIRKEMGGLRLRGVKTLNLDRVVLMDFGERKLVFELFRDGNLILIDRDGRVIDLLREGTWRHRSLRRGSQYTPPPPPPLSRGEILSDSFLIRDLIRSGVPRPYAFEVINRLGVGEKTPTSSLSVDVLLEEIESILKELRSPSGYICGGEPFPISLTYLPCERKASHFWEVVDAFTPSFFSSSEEEKNKDRLYYMERSLTEIDTEIRTLEQLLQEIYENWGELDTMLRSGNFSDVGKLRFKRKEGSHAIFEFNP